MRGSMPELAQERVGPRAASNHAALQAWSCGAISPTVIRTLTAALCAGPRDRRMDEQECQWANFAHSKRRRVELFSRLAAQVLASVPAVRSLHEITAAFDASVPIASHPTSACADGGHARPTDPAATASAAVSATELAAAFARAAATGTAFEQAQRDSLFGSAATRNHTSRAVR
jgi:hypothetical protein